MKLVTWNASRGKFSAKVPWLDVVSPDIAIVQEIARPSVDLDGRQTLWFGDNPDQGVAVIANAGCKLEPLPQLDGTPKFCYPVQVSGQQSFLLLAIWTLKTAEHTYVEALFRVIETYRELIEAQATVIAGDFNSNSRFDRDYPADRNHTSFVERLSLLGLESAYHLFFCEKQGAETRPTFFHFHHEDKPHHLDYVFLPRSWTVAEVSVGTFADWAGKSDHRPVSVEAGPARPPESSK